MPKRDEQRVVASAGTERETGVDAEHLEGRTGVVVPVANRAEVEVHAVGDGVRVEQIPELRQLLQRAVRPLAAESARRGVEDLAPAAKRRKRKQQPALRVRGVGALERRLDGDEVATRERGEHLLASGRRRDPPNRASPGMKSA